jgi:hypothetical protein
VKDGKDPYQFLTRENIDKLMMGIRSPAQVARDRLIATGGAAAEEVPNTPLPPVPEGISKAGWDSLMQAPPLTPTGKRMSHAQWGVVLQQLKESPTPEMKAAFDKWGAAANFKADEVLARLGGQLGPKAEPTAAQTGVLPKETLPSPAPEAPASAKASGTADASHTDETKRLADLRSQRHSAIQEGLLAISEGRAPRDVEITPAAPVETAEQIAARQATRERLGHVAAERLSAVPKQTAAVRDEVVRRQRVALATQAVEQLKSQLTALDTREKGALNATQKEILAKQRTWLEEQLGDAKKKLNPDAK